MFVMGLDVDKLLCSQKILLYAKNFYISSPLVLITFGTIYLKNILGSWHYKLHLVGKAKYFSEQSAGNFNLVTNTSVVTRNIYTRYFELPLISEHIPQRKNKLTNNEFGYFLAGLIEGEG